MANFLYSQRVCAQFFASQPSFHATFPSDVVDLLEDLKSRPQEFQIYVNAGESLFSKSFAVVGPSDLDKSWLSQRSLTAIVQTINLEANLFKIAQAVCPRVVSNSPLEGFFAALGVLAKDGSRAYQWIRALMNPLVLHLNNHCEIADVERVLNQMYPPENLAACPAGTPADNQFNNTEHFLGNHIIMSHSASSKPSRLPVRCSSLAAPAKPCSVKSSPLRRASAPSTRKRSSSSIPIPLSRRISCPAELPSSPSSSPPLSRLIQFTGPARQIPTLISPSAPRTQTHTTELLATQRKRSIDEFEPAIAGPSTVESKRSLKRRKTNDGFTQEDQKQPTSETISVQPRRRRRPKRVAPPCITQSILLDSKLSPAPQGGPSPNHLTKYFDSNDTTNVIRHIPKPSTSKMPSSSSKFSLFGRSPAGKENPTSGASIHSMIGSPFVDASVNHTPGGKTTTKKSKWNRKFNPLNWGRA